MKLTALLLGGLLCASQAQAWCFSYAAQRYNVDPLILMSIAIHESDLKPGAVGINRAGSRVLSKDYCLMQVNTGNVDRLIKMNVITSARDLLEDPCLCVQAGTWVLATHLRKCGATWSCLGSYNAGFSKTPRQEQRRQDYAARIRTIYERLQVLNRQSGSSQL